MKKYLDYFILVVLFLTHLLLSGLSIYWIMSAIGFSINIINMVVFQFPLLLIVITSGYFYFLYGSQNKKRSITKLNMDILSFELYLTIIFFALFYILPRNNIDKPTSSSDGMIIFIALLVLGLLISILAYIYYSFLLRRRK